MSALTKRVEKLEGGPRHRRQAIIVTDERDHEDNDKLIAKYCEKNNCEPDDCDFTTITRVFVTPDPNLYPAWSNE